MTLRLSFKTFRWLLFGVVGSSMFLSSCSGDRNPTGDVRVDEQRICDDLKIIGSKRIYFGHQSVGNNLLDGVRDIQSACGDTSVRLINLAEIQDVTGPFFAESTVGRNKEPFSKCTAFAEAVERFSEVPLDIAFMKFCYVDFTSNTNVNHVFDAYCVMVDSLKTAMPHTTLIHVSVPLLNQTVGWKRFLKSMIGRADEREGANLQRARYNRLLASRFSNDPIFDLARVESTLPDGTRNATEVNGEAVYYLLGDFTDDGGHLNGRGRVEAAREMLRVLAIAARRDRHTE
jgi:hypothetical protein